MALMLSLSYVFALLRMMLFAVFVSLSPRDSSGCLHQFTTEYSCTPPSKFGIGYPTGWAAVEAEPEPGTRVPGRHRYPGYHTLFGSFLALLRRRVRRTRVSGYPGTRVNMHYFILFLHLSCGVVRRTWVAGYPGYHTLFSPLVDFEWRVAGRVKFSVGSSREVGSAGECGVDIIA